MPTRNDPRPVAVSNRVYRAFLRIYPRRFRLQYREEMALVFRDSCRDAYRESGAPGLLPIWWRAMLDLAKTVPEEHGELLLVGNRATSEPAWSCSGCSSEVELAWPTCPICGEILNENTRRLRQASLANREGFFKALSEGTRGFVGGPGL